MEALGMAHDLFRQFGQPVAIEAGLDLELRPVAAPVEVGPVVRQLTHHRPARPFLGLLDGGFELTRTGCEGLPQRLPFLNLPIEERLRDGRVIDLAMPVETVSDQIDHHIAAEFVPVLQGQPSDSNDRFGILAVDVEDGNW